MLKIEFHKSFLIFFCPLLFFSVISCSSKREILAAIEENNKKLSESIETQTALFYRTVGEAIPVVVPEEAQKRLTELSEKTTALIDTNEIDEKKFDEDFELYINYVSTVSPWIQEEQVTDLFQVKYDLDYLKILIYSQQNPDNANRVLEKLSDFINQSQQYSKIVQVQSRYDEIASNQMKSLKSRADKFLKSETYDSSEYQIFLSETEDFLTVLYEDNKEETENYRLLQKLIDDIKVREIELSNKKLKANYGKMFDEFVKAAKQNKVSQSDYVDLQKQIPIMQETFPGEYDDDDIILYEWKLLSELNNQFSNVKTKIEEIENDLGKYSDFAVAQISSDITAIDLNLALFSKIKSSDLKSLQQGVLDFEKRIEKLREKNLEAENKLYISDYDKAFNQLKQKTLSGSFSLSDYGKLQNQLAAIQNIYPEEYSSRIILLEELKIYSEISEGLKTCKAQIESLKVGEFRLNDIKISSVNQQLNSISYNLSLIKNIDIKNFSDETEKLNKALAEKISFLEKNSDEENARLVKNYNSSVIALLKRTNTENNRLNDKNTFKKLKKNEKRKSIIEGKMQLLNDLEKINTSYLYSPVYTMYSQVYSLIWSSTDGEDSLNMEEQFAVLEKSLITTKWGLYDEF
ncbi:MAG: hypothetical protein SPL22_05100 [Treponema sp.]|uniref:hypothetical protein n=1 Tax=Treponema sp. TaxID=166 RepID=UPI002A91039E|nr:hypothetical protein [Treponema sp.]MDY6397089.1 hypothetical protein [Treponema sp.]